MQAASPAIKIGANMHATASALGLMLREETRIHSAVKSSCGLAQRQLHCHQQGIWITLFGCCIICRSRVMSLRLFTGALLAVTLAAAPALACTGQELFSDDFKEVDFGWPEQKDAAVGAGKAVLKPAAGRATALVYGGALFDDADICVDLSIGQARDPAALAGGLVFWHDDFNNTSVLLISADRGAALLRWQKAKRLDPVAWRAAESLKPGADAVNSLRDTLKGNAVTVYFNDKVFASVKAPPPDGGGKIGFWAESEKDGPVVFTFSKLRVTAPPR
jgi:hypothetical protein